MIPMTPDEIATLVKARDILADKALRPETGGGLALSVHDGIKLILRVSHVEAEAEIVAAEDNPTPGPTGEPPESPGEKQQPGGGVWGGGPPPQLPGIGFMPSKPEPVGPNPTVTKEGESQ